jgi:hypothetical protein
MSPFLPFALVWFLGFVYYIFLLALDDEIQTFGWQLVSVGIIAIWPISMTFLSLIDDEESLSFSDYIFIVLLLASILYPFY